MNTAPLDPDSPAGRSAAEALTEALATIKLSMAARKSASSTAPRSAQRKAA